MKWVKTNRKKWCDTLSDNVKQIVIRWWIKETKVNLNMKDAVRHLTNPNTWEKHVAHFLQEGQVLLASTPILFYILFVCLRFLFFDFL